MSHGASHGTVVTIGAASELTARQIVRLADLYRKWPELARYVTAQRKLAGYGRPNWRGRAKRFDFKSTRW